MKPSRSQASLRQRLVQLYRLAVQANVPLTAVDKRISTTLLRGRTTLQLERGVDKQLLREQAKKRPLLLKLVGRGLPIAMVILGIVAVASAVVPITSYFLFTSPELLQGSLTAPIPSSKILQLPIASAVMAKDFTEYKGQVAAAETEIDSAPVILNQELEYINLSHWFPSDTLPELAGTNQNTVSSSEYILDIPELDIVNARVRVGGTNLDKSLIQYQGTALPGDAGAPVIFGHSVLRQFYNPSVKNARRYISIFSKIMTLKQGDAIYVTRDGVKYTYIVQDKTEVKPEDTYILQQNYQYKELKMVTCVPEGTYLRRGVITARLQE